MNERVMELRLKKKIFFGISKEYLINSKYIYEYIDNVFSLTNKKESKKIPWENVIDIFRYSKINNTSVLVIKYIFNGKEKLLKLDGYKMFSNTMRTDFNEFVDALNKLSKYGEIKGEYKTVDLLVRRSYKKDERKIIHGIILLFLCISGTVFLFLYRDQITTSKIAILSICFFYSMNCFRKNS